MGRRLMGLGLLRLQRMGILPLNTLPQSLRCVYAKPLRVIESLTNELEAYTSERKIDLLRLVRLILTADY